ncbi:CalY family protein [Nocardioides sp. W7]|uniref:CalY family protein n=1 Tax=Nocardioides sp. W7 TaxID=2931390 RepID=UPI001FD1AE34|nr:CalY family protein [Nocardioides sp. W7]
MRKLTTVTSTKVLASVALVTGAAAVAGLGTFGAFTSTTAAAQNVGTGTVAISSDKSGSLSAPVTGMVPGDTVDRAIKLTNTGSETFGNVYLTATATGDQVLVDPTAANSLRVAIDSCATPWTAKAGTTELTCATAPVSIVAEKTVGTSGLDLPKLTDELNGTAKAANLRVRLALPYNKTANDNALQGKTAALNLTFDATQRAGQAR